MRSNVIICGGGPEYYVGGWLFEMHRYCGPSVLDKRTGELRQGGGYNPPRTFWRAFKCWQKMSQEDKDQCCVEQVRPGKWVYKQSRLPIGGH